MMISSLSFLLLLFGMLLDDAGKLAGSRELNETTVKCKRESDADQSENPTRRMAWPEHVRDRDDDDDDEDDAGS